MEKTRIFAWTALLAALVFLLGLTPLGLIPLGFINVTVLCLPVIIGALLMGPVPGLVLGAAFGGVSIIRLLQAPSTLAGNLMAASPPLALLMSLLPRLMIPLTSCWTYRALQRGPLRRVSGAVASAAGSLTNTVLYLGLMLAFYHLAGLGAEKVLALILSIGILAGGAEAAVAALLVPPVLLALRKISKQQ